MKTAIIISGQHVASEGWERIVWGDPETGVLGRVPRALKEALFWEADTIFFGTGGSEREGKKEGEYTLDYTYRHLQEIPEFEAMGAEAAHAWLSARAVLELTARNTREEMLADARLAHVRGCERLIIVSSPTHVLRCHKEALSVFAQEESLRPFLHSLYAVASDVSFMGSTVDDVVIIEPAHRPDKAKTPLHKTLARIVPFIQDHDAAEALNTDLIQVLDTHEKRSA